MEGKKVLSDLISNLEFMTAKRQFFRRSEYKGSCHLSPSFAKVTFLSFDSLHRAVRAFLLPGNILIKRKEKSQPRT